MEKTLDVSVVSVAEWKSAECSCEELAYEERESSRKRSRRIWTIDFSSDVIPAHVNLPK